MVWWVVITDLLNYKANEVFMIYYIIVFYISYKKRMRNFYGHFLAFTFNFGLSAKTEAEEVSKSL